MKDLIQSIKDLWGEDHYITFEIISITQHEWNVINNLFYKYYGDHAKYVDKISKKMANDRTIIFFCSDFFTYELCRIEKTPDRVCKLQFIFANRSVKTLQKVITYLDKRGFSKRTRISKLLLVSRIKSYQIEDEVKGRSIKLSIFYGWHRKEISTDMLELIKIVYRKKLTDKFYGIYLDEFLADYYESSE